MNRYWLAAMQMYLRPPRKLLGLMRLRSFLPILVALELPGVGIAAQPSWVFAADMPQAKADSANPPSADPAKPDPAARTQAEPGQPGLGGQAAPDKPAGPGSSAGAPSQPEPEKAVPDKSPGQPAGETPLAKPAVPQGNTSQGNTSQGNTSQGNTAQGNTAQGKASQNNASQGESSQPAAPQPVVQPPPDSPAQTSTAETPEDDLSQLRGPSFSRLLDPELSKQIELTAEQRSHIAALLAEREQRLARVSAAERQQVIDYFERRLSRVLTAQQREKWSQLRVEPKLKFNFRYARWIDVLQWFAEQADMSLVLDAPPPGTFNYADTREYTPAEAIDLLNGVLLTKGFTLVRRGRMLLLVDLKDGVPEGLVPRVELGDLDRHGKFELVTVQFPIGRRPVSTVVAEIKPLLGPHGKIVPLAAAQQVLVTDAAGVMRSVQAIIASIPEPEGVPAPVPTGQPVLANYPLPPAQAKTALKVLSTLLPTAKIVVDEETGQLHVSATASEQEMVKKVLADIQAARSPDKQPQLEVYPVAEAAAQQVIDTLKLAVPEARVTFDQSGNRLVAWASTEQHELIKKTIEKLDAERAPGRTRQLEVYRISRIDPQTTLETLQRILPDAKLAIDPQTKMLVALAVPADHQTIRQTLQLLAPEKPGEEPAELRFYPLAFGIPPEALAILKRQVPDASIAMDNTADRIVAVATPREHERIKAAIERLEKVAGLEGRSRLVIYPVTPAERKRFLAVLNSLKAQAAGIQVIVDAEPGELAVWAKPQQHEMVAEILKELRRDVPPEERFQLVGYSVEGADPNNALSILQSLFPNTKLLLDAKTNRILAWTKPAEHEQIKASLEQIRQQSGQEGQARFEVYQTGGAGGYQLLSTLQTLVPGAKLSTDPKTGNLVAWATAAEHDRLKAALGKLTRGAAADEEAEIEVYRLTRGDPKAAINLLQEMMPGAKLSLDPQTGSIIALAIPQDQKRIRDALERLQQAAPADDKRLAAYTLKSADPAVVVEMLEKLFPGAKFVSDRRSGKLAVLAAPADQEAIKAAIEDLDSGPAQPQGPEKVVTYHAPKGSTTLALEVLREMVPTARFQADKYGDTIVAWARQHEHETIKRVLEDLSGESDPEKKPTLEVYPIDVTAAQRLYNALAAIVPNARLSLDTAGQRLVVWGTGKEHELVKQTIAKLEAGGMPASSKRLAVYRLTKTDPASLVNLLQNVAPNARVAVDSGTKSVVVYASEADQKAIQQTVEQLEKSAEGERDKLVSYPLKSADATTMLTVLQKMFPRAQFVHDRRANRLAVTAKAEEHEAIRSAIEELDKGPPAGEGPDKVQTYQLPKGGATVALEVLRELVPGARFQLDHYGGTLVAWAREAEHETIKRVLEDLSGQNDPEKKPRLEVYPIDVTNRERLYYMLSPMVPEAKLTIDADSGKLVVWATPKDHQTIKEAISKLGIGGAAAGSRQMVAYQLTKADPQTVLTLLQTLLPTAKLAVDSRTQTLVAVATEADHQSIRKLLEQLQPEKPGPNDPELRVYPVKSADLDNVVKAAGKLYPNAQFIVDRRGRRILVMARLDDQPGIEKLLQQLDSGQPGDADESLAVYTIHKGDAKTIASMLQQIFPDMYFGADLKTGAVIARGTAADQQALAKVIERLNLPDEEHRPVVVSYGTGSADPATVQAMLAKLLPTATVTADAKTRTVVALATKREQELIRDAVDRLVKGGEGTAFKAATYSIEAATPAAAIALLKEAAPGAIIAEGAEPRQIVAWAREEDHKVIAELVAQLAKQGPDESAPRVEVYNLRSGSAAGFVMALKFILPEARCGVGSNPRQLVAYARPADHKRIAEIVEKMSEREPAETAPQIRLYTLRSIGAAAAAKALAAALPEAQFSVGADPSQLIAYARPADQQIIKAAVEEMEREGLADSRRVLTVYPMKAKDAQALLGVLDPKLLAEARVLADPERDGLIVWAEPRQHEAIRSAVEQFKKQMPEANEPVARVYRFRRAEPKAAQAAIARLVPNAQIGVDLINRALVVSALPQEHQKIAEAVRQLDEETENSPRLQMHRLASADPLGLLPVLQALFKQRTDVQLAADSSRDAIIAVAPPADHELIRTLIEQVEKAATDHQAKLQLYSLRDIDSTAAVDVITKVLDKLGGKAELTVEPYSNQLIAIARPEHHELIAQTLERLKSDERQLEIIALDNVDPNTATLAINRLFAGERLNSPEVQVDPATQQLFIRGSKEQIARIRQLLVKLGETSLAVQPSGTGPIRTIQFQGDAQEAIEQLQRIWPQLRDNPIRIVTPSAIAPLLRKSREAAPAPNTLEDAPSKPSAEKPQHSPQPDSPGTAPAEKPQQPPPEKLQQPPPEKSQQQPPVNPQQPPAGPSQQPPPPESRQQPPPTKDAKEPSGAAGSMGPRANGFPIAALVCWFIRGAAIRGAGCVLAAEPVGRQPSPQVPDAPQQRRSEPQQAPASPASPAHPSQPQPSSQAQQKPSDSSQQPQPEAPQAQQPQPKAPQTQQPPPEPPAEGAEEDVPQSKPGAPILIAISDGNIVIASDDLDALDQFEMLLRALSQRSGAPGRNFAVYPLRNTSAARVAATLQQVFRTAQPATPDGTTMRTGRATSSVVIVPDERTNSLLVQANRTDRATIENLLKLLDVGELPNAEQRKPRTIPIKNTSAARVEQIIRSVFKSDLSGGVGGTRGAGSGPSWLNTEIVVDELTNSLLVTGPTALLDHIEQFARHLDQTAGEDTSRELTIIPLKKANAARVQAILDSMLGKPSSGSAGRPRSVVPTAPRSQSGSRRPASHGGSTAPATPPPKNY